MKSILILLLLVADVRADKLLWFTASWCGPCRAMRPKVEAIKGQVKVVEIDVDRYPQYARKWGVRGIPCFISVKDDGTETGRLVGSTSESRLKAMAGVKDD